MNISESGISLIKGFEVFVGYVYDDQDKSWPRRRLTRWEDCRGTATMGYGSLYSRSLPLPHDITEAYADGLLRAQLRDYVAAVERACKVTPTQNQFDALTSFAYNEGQDAVAKCSIVKALNAGETDPAIFMAHFLEWSKWRVNGELVTSEGLLLRRRKEAELFCKGMAQPLTPSDVAPIIPLEPVAMDADDAARRDTDPAPPPDDVA